MVISAAFELSMLSIFRNCGYLPMRTPILLFALMLSMSIVGDAVASEKTVALSVETMVCGPDPHNVKDALLKIMGVSNVQISLTDKTATVTFDDQKATVNALLTAMAGAGYAALAKDVVQ
jgi:periplasmic mercuric ion binding protein